MTECIRPGVMIDGRTVYPPGWLWLLAFAVGGCKWAQDALEEKSVEDRIAELWLGDGI